MYKIIGADQKEYGPVTADQLRQWISEGRINASTKILPEGATAWKSVSELPEFVALLPPGPPPVPTTPMPIAMAPVVPKSNQMAVWAMITGIISVVCCQILSPLSIVLGILALSQIKQNPKQSGSGFAIAGIVLGIISMIILGVAILILVSFPECLTNLQNSFSQ